MGDQEERAAQEDRPVQENHLEVEKRIRAGKAGWLSRAVARCEASLRNISSLSGAEYEEVVSNFEMRLRAWDELQERVEALLTTEEELTQDIGRAGEYREQCVDSRLRLETAWRQIQGNQEAEDGDSSSVTSRKRVHKLPKLELPKFFGEILKFTTFWEQFVASIDSDEELDDITKFNYLLNSLRGSSKDCLEGLSVTAENYAKAKTILKGRYGRSELIVFSHIQSLLALEIPSMDIADLLKFRDKLSAHVRSLETLKITSEKFGVILTPIIVSRLPEEMRLEWSRTSAEKEADLNHLMSFLEAEVSRRERSKAFGSLKPSDQTMRLKPNKEPERRGRGPGTAAALVSGRGGENCVCVFCGRNHKTEKCHKGPKEKTELAKSRGLCFRCLSEEHRASMCQKICALCKGAHHRFLCYGPKSHPKEEKPPTDNSVKTDGDSVKEGDSALFVSDSGKKVSLLPIATVNIASSSGKVVKATLLFDSGSEKSYVSSNLVRKCSPKWLESTELRFSAFGGIKSSSRADVFELSVHGVNGEVVKIVATEVPVICSPLRKPRVSASVLAGFSHLDLGANLEAVDKSLCIDILIGLDLYWSLMSDEIYRPSDRSMVVAQRSVVGWVLSGSSGSCEGSSPMTNTFLNLTDIPEEVVKSFWSLESIGVESESINPVLSRFQETVRFNEDERRYEVGLSWKPAEVCPNLQDNKSRAEALNSSLQRRLGKDPKLKEEYESALREMEELGFIEEVPLDQWESSENLVYYLPHHPHIRESSSSTRIRPVFNASSKGRNGVSLNDCLESGPNLNPTVTELLVRFRRWRVAISSDIKKAFLQIMLQEQDRDVHRFLWSVGGRVRVMRFVRVTFGIKCSPFLLTATIRHHLSRCPPSTVVMELADNTYVDDFLSGADSVEEARTMYKEADKVMKSAGMVLTKWSSNENSVFEWKTDPKGLSMKSDEYTKVLGVSWEQSGDSLTFVGIDIPEITVVTKRVILSLIPRVYDPTGFLLPVVVTGKLLFQECWRLQLAWDEGVPDYLDSEFRSWIQNIESMKNDVRMPRQYFPGAWREQVTSGLELHVFGDASPQGYGACVYLVCPSGSEGDSSLVLACARVAPLTPCTLPRLELLGALVAARLIVRTREMLRLPSVKCFAWTDSMIALGWILGNPTEWKPWVRNRVTEIQKLTDSCEWNHCPGVENPADLVTRSGISAEKLKSCELWWKGPSFLRDPSIRPEVHITFPSEIPEVQEERRPSKDVVLICTEDTEEPVFDLRRWSTLSKAYSVVRLVLKYIKILKHRVEAKRNGQTESMETCDVSREEVRVTFLKTIQLQYFHRELEVLKKKRTLPRDSKLTKLNPFIDEDGLMRVTGRLQLSELAYESKHPVILPECHGTKLIVKFVHLQNNHAGTEAMITAMRAQYEVFGLRGMAKRVKRGCVACCRQDAKNCNEVAAPLPKVRVTRAPVFSVTGLDFAGPVYCLDEPDKKYYICLFVCGVVRAIHLELTESLNRDDFVLAFRRFAALKRMPSFVYSDNGGNIRAGEKLIRAYLGPSAPEWRFICPRSPWWGGWWERLVRSVKSAIRKSIGKSRLTRTEVETCLHEVAASVNSRPLTFVGTDIENKPALTPNHFLTGLGSQGMESVVEDPEDVSEESLDLRHQEMMRRLDDFWGYWTSEYLRNLPQSYQRHRKEGNLEIGSVVLIREDGLPRMKWLLGRVVKLHVGKDGIARAADLKTEHGIRTRPVQKLYYMEMKGGITDDIDIDVREAGDKSSSVESDDDHTRVDVDVGVESSKEMTDSVTDESCVRSERPKRSRKLPSQYSDFVLD